MNRRVAPAVVAGLVVLWMMLVIGAYYIFHKPFPLEQAGALASLAANLVAVAAVVSAAAGLGHALLARRAQDVLSVLSLPERLALEALAGLGVVALIVLALGMAGLLHGRLLALAVIAAAALLYKHAVAWQRALIGWLRDGIGSLAGGWTRWLAVFVALMLGMAFLNALAPATRWDGLTYHLTGPKLYAEAGRIHNDIPVPYFGFPQLTEMLYLLLMAALGPAANAALMHWVFGALLLMLTGGFAARLTGAQAKYGLFAAALLLSGATLWGEFAWPYVELSMMAYTMAAFALLGVPPIPNPSPHEGGKGAGARSESPLPPCGGGDLGVRGRKLFILAGLMAGFALGVKYTAVGAAAGLGLLALWRVRRGGVRGVLTGGAVFALAALLSFAPWLVKNVLLYGNPVYPFFFETANGDWDHWRQAWFTRPGTGLLNTAPARLLVLPWDATVCSAEGVAAFGAPFGDALLLCDPGGAGSLNATIGPLFLVLIPMLLAAWPALDGARRRFAGHAALFVLPAYVLWACSVGVTNLLAQTRLLFAVFPALAVLAALGFEGVQAVRAGQVRAGVLVGAMVAFALAASLAAAALDTAKLDALPVAVGAQPRDDFLTAHLGSYYQAMQQINALPGGGTAVQFLWEPRSFYCRDGMVCYPDALLDAWYHAMRVYDGDVYAISEAWREDVTHVLVYHQGMRYLTAPGGDPFLPGDAEAVEAFIDEYLTPVWEGKAGDGAPVYVLYTWK